MIIVYALFFLSYPIYRLFLQDLFTVTSLKNKIKTPKKKKGGRNDDMSSSDSSAQPVFRMRRQSTMSVSWDEKIVWPGL